MSIEISALEPAGGRRERRKRETRERIRQAAAALFAEQGYEETKVVDICARADVAYQTFFNHFPEKSDLLNELFRVGIDFVWGTLDTALREGRDTRERLRIFFSGLMGAAVDLGPRHRELVAAILGPTADARRVEHSRRMSEAFAALVERGRAEGDVTTRYDLEVMAPLVEGALGALVGSWTRGADFDLRRRALEIADLVADALEPRADETPSGP